VQKEFNDLKLFVTGGHEINSDIVDYIQQKGMEDKIVFTGYLDDIQLRKLQSGASLAIIYKHDNLQNKFCFPTKLIDYIALRIPVILTDVGSIPDYFVNMYNSILIPPGDLDCLIEKIRFLLVNDKVRRQLANNAFKLLSREFNYIEQTGLLKNFLSEHVK
ncbi:MAG: glycosyltransferase, partial [Chloroflexi bacterium]